MDEATQMMIDNASDEVMGSVGSVKNSKNSISPLEPFQDLSLGDDENREITLDIEKTGGTHGTDGTASNDAASSGSATENSDGTGGTSAFKIDLEEATDPLHDAEEEQIEKLSFADLDTPCFLVKDDWFDLGGKRRPGVYWCYETEAAEKKPSIQVVSFICSPLYIDAVTNTESGAFFGRLLRFRDTLGHWRKWAMPMELLRGSCEELRGELLAAGVKIDTRNRQKLADYLQWKDPRPVVTAATRTGWTVSGKSFVLHDRVIGSQDVYFQSESMVGDGASKVGGDYRQWQKIAAYCKGNPVLMTSLSVAFSGPLLAKVHKDSGGVHWVGDSSTGKTTALTIGASVWGGEDFKRTWRATSNGLEGVAALLSDTCLCLDEISEAEPREVGAIVYSLGNGVGKTRANRIGSARHVHRWRLSLLSTGERSISAAMAEGGKQAKAGQLVRLLNIPAARQHGVFDDLHVFEDGRAMSDYFKTQCAKHYGHAGVKFVEYIIGLEQKGDSDFGGTIAHIEQQFHSTDTQAARAASRFALYALAGELATDAGILPWKQGAAIDACKTMFDQWQAMRGTGATEHKQILQSVADYILKHGDTRFTDKATSEPPRLERAGWYTERNGERVYLFTPAAIKEAGGNYDAKRVLDALDVAGWIVERDYGERSKKTSTTGGSKPRLYWVLPSGADHA